MGDKTRTGGGGGMRSREEVRVNGGLRTQVNGSGLTMKRSTAGRRVSGLRGRGGQFTSELVPVEPPGASGAAQQQPDAWPRDEENPHQDIVC